MSYLLSLILLTVIALLSVLKAGIPREKLLSELTDAESRFFHWQGIQVHFKDKGNGVPIVLLHGTSSSLHTWDLLAAHLKVSFRVIRMDLMGCGITGPHPEGLYSLPTYMKFIDDFTHFLGLTEFIIAGNSWGGWLSWNYALHNPGNLNGLILINAAGFRMHKTPRRFVLIKFGAGRWLLKYVTPKWMVKTGLKEVTYSSQLIDRNMVRRYWLLTLREGNRKAFIDIIRSRGGTSVKRLATIKTPTLILWGQHDRLYPAHQALMFKELIPHAHLKFLKNAGHIPMEETPTQCHEEIKKFINDLKL